MKFSSLLLLVFISLQTFATDLQRTVSFDFFSPQTLSTPITPAEVNGGFVILGDIDFTALSAKISFDSPGTGASPEIQTFVNIYTGEASYFLKIPSGSKVIVSAMGDATLDAVIFEGTMGGLALEYGQPGKMGGAMGREWIDADQEHPKSVSFMANAWPGEINKIVVKYTEPSIALKPIASSYANGDTISSFKSLDLTFDRNIYKANASQVFTMTYKEEKKEAAETMNLTVSTSGKVATFVAPRELTADGIVSIDIPASSFRDTEQPYSEVTDSVGQNTKGYENAALHYTFTLRAARNTFECLSVTPDTGKVEKVPETVTLKFDNDVTIADNASIKLYQNGTAKYPVSVSVDETDHSLVHLTYSHNGEITEPGEWSFVIPEKTIHNPFLGDEVDDRWNPELTLTYTIPEPEPEPEPEISEMWKQAKALLENPEYTGVGYPALTSDARMHLEEVVKGDSISNDSINQLMEEAIGAFYNETNVTMPVLDKWYTIQGVNSEGKSIYLSLSETKDSVLLSADAGKAAAFKVADTDGNVIVFETLEGKFLHILTTSTEYRRWTTPANVTNERDDEVNRLTLSKLIVAGADSTKTFGKLTIYGLLGDGVYSTAAINYTNGTIVDTPTEGIYFDGEQSSAFILKETKNPTTITPQVVLTPTVIENDTVPMTLSFTNVSKVKLEEKTAPYFMLVQYDRNGKQISEQKVTTTAESILTAVAGSDNTFMVHADGLDGLADALSFYRLVMPTGTFSYDGNELAVTDTLLQDSFRIKGFNYSYDIISWLEENERYAMGQSYIADTDLNSFVLFSMVNAPFSGLVADPTKQVRLMRYYTNQLVRTGHFEPYPGFSNIPGYEGYQAIRLVLDSPIEAGELQYTPGLYVYDVPQGTYGDLNFGKYISGDTSIDKSTCIANVRKGFQVQVDNDLANATGIQSVEAAQPADGAVYDLTGRRVDQSQQKPGLYIVNGKKVVIR